jgi:membrane protein DedA with SNARE-associated domain
VTIIDPEVFVSFLSWIELHPILASVVVFAISLSESLVVVGLFIPGLVVMGIIGGLVSAGTLNLSATLICATLGAIFGDSISYSIGRRFKDHLPDLWLFKKFPHWLGRGKKFFTRYGEMSIIFGRFVGPVRPFIPVIAGMMLMNPKRFLIANIISAILWAPIYMLPGMGIATWLSF